SHGGGPGNGHGTGGGVSGAGADAGGGSGEGDGNGSQGPLARMGQLADKALHALAGDRSTPFQQLLSHLMDSPAGRAGRSPAWPAECSEAWAAARPGTWSVSWTAGTSGSS